MPQGMEWVIIAIVALLLFGGTRLAGIGKSAGKAIREFKEETAAAKGEPAAPADPPAIEPPVTTFEQPAAERKTETEA